MDNNYENLDTFLDNYSIWKNEKHFIIKEKISDKMEEHFKKKWKIIPCGSGKKYKQCCGK